MSVATVDHGRAIPTRVARATVAAVVAQGVVVVAIAALAASRADGNELSPLALAGVAAGAAAAGAFIAWPAGLFAGAADVNAHGPDLDCDPDCPARGGDDPFTPRALWRRAFGLAAVAGVWAAAAGGLAAVALDGRPAGWPVILAVLGGTAGVAAVAVDIAGRHRGAHATVHLLAAVPPAVPVRQRAWREVALPLALAQVVVNAGAAWVLFHGRSTGDHLAPDALTRDVALSDIGVVVLLVTVVFALALGHEWGRVDATAGRVAFDESSQRVDAKTPMRVAGVLYVAAAGWLGAGALGWVLPTNPGLAAVMVVRGVYAGLLVLALTAFGYVRGAINAAATSNGNDQIGD